MNSSSAVVESSGTVTVVTELKQLTNCTCVRYTHILSSSHPNPLDGSIGNYSLADLHHQYKKYTDALSTFSSNHFPPITELHFGPSHYRTHPIQT